MEEPGAVFVEWMLKNRFNLHKDTSFHHYTDERGYSLLTTEAIVEDTTLFMIPDEMVLWPGTSQLSKEHHVGIYQ